MKTMFRRQFTTAVILILLCLSLLAVGFGGLLYSFLVRESQDDVLNAAQAVQQYAESYQTSGSMDNYYNVIRMALSMCSEISGNQIFITNETGYIFQGGDPEFQSKYLYSTIPESILSNADSSGTYTGITTLGGLFDNSHYVAILTLVNSNGEITGYVIASADMDDTLSLMSRVLLLFVLSAAAVIIIALMVSSATARRQAKPLKEMAEASRRFAYGDFGTRVNEENPVAEIKDLAGAFNAMAEALTISEMKRRDFVDSVSHDLKTPMTTISGYVDGMLDGTIPPEQAENCLHTISAETKRLSRLVRSFLDLSRLQSKIEEIQGSELMVMEDFEIDEVLRLTLVSCEDRITKKNLDVDIDIGDEPVHVLGMQDSIMQVAYNLLDNAIKFAIPNTTLGIKLIKSGRKAFVTISNYGPTISPEEQKMIFERFHKTDSSRSSDKDGVGLGLYIVKTIINTHNEDITLKSESGITEFTFSLALSK